MAADELNWGKAIEHFTERAKENKADDKEYVSDIAIANICRYMQNEYCGEPLKVIKHYGYMLHIGKTYCTNLSKELIVRVILGNKVEICLADNVTGVIRYFFPHPTHMEALDRFKAIVQNINWDMPVIQNNGWIDWIFKPMVK